MNHLQLTVFTNRKSGIESSLKSSKQLSAADITQSTCSNLQKKLKQNRLGKAKHDCDNLKTIDSI